MRKVHDIRKHDGDVGMAIGDVGLLTLQTDRNRLRQDIEQEPVGEIFFQGHGLALCIDPGTPMDFQQPTQIGERFAQLNPKLNGYDHNYLLGEGRTMKMAARLTEPKSGRVLEVRMTQPAVQLYTGNHLKNTAVCLETQHYPDAIHHTNFPSIVVRPGQPLRETTLFTFLAK